MSSQKTVVLNIPGTGPFDLTTWEHDRIVHAAERHLCEEPITITAHPAPRSTGGINDFFSEGDYWWPDPRDPDGPYIRRDGETNPDNFTAHREVLRGMSIHVPTLAAAWLSTGRNDFAAKAGAHLRAWFAEPATRMTPHLEYGQAIKGICTGRGIGIVDTIHLAEVAVAVRVLAALGAIDPHIARTTTEWFRQYMIWLTTSRFGIDERDHGNNHTTCWVLQVAAFAALCNDEDVLTDCRNRYRNILLMQMAPDGSFPLELERTRPYNYSIFNLDMMAALCQLFATMRREEWNTRSPSGRTILDAMENLFPAMIDKSRWPMPPDVAWFDRMPVRNAMLLFGAVAFGRRQWLDLWKRLDPDPVEDELVRNHPIRQPMLWYIQP